VTEDERMSRYFQPHISRMTGYVPGEQPTDRELIKLNTNENPYPPSPRVAEAIIGALDGRLRLYPDPLSTVFRQAVSRRFGVDAGWVMASNGSDDLLTIITRAFASPRDRVVYPTPSYILYRTLAELQNADWSEVPFSKDWDLDPARVAALHPKLVFLANPNSPSGTSLPPGRVRELAEAIDCPLVVDEAYADFADADCIGLVDDLPNVIVTRTLSKSAGLAGLRIGFLIARPELIAGLIKVKDSYNCDLLSLVGGAAALDDGAYFRETRSKILATRQRLLKEARSLGYTAPDSQSNFVWCTGGPPAGEVYQALRDRKILVRIMRYSGLPDGLRITVGTDAEIDLLLSALKEILVGIAAPESKTARGAGERGASAP
jgi:histidinol-phosphate aminotransferase